jgi:two-component system sensor histidine kinase SenX3
MHVYGSQLSAVRRPKWFPIAMGVTLILVALALTVGWQFLGISVSPEISTARWLVYFFGSLLFGLLIGGLVLIVILLVREVRLNERQSNFVSAVTHELKTPVASLKLYLETLQLRDVSESRRSEFYETMGQDIDRLHATINNVLNATRYADRPAVDPQPLDLAKLARRAIELTRTRNQLPVETIRYDGEESLMILGNAEALETAVLNLLDNAVKYSKDAVAVEVEVRVTLARRACLRVRDHGIGMARHHLRLIFNRFYRIGTEVRRRHTGTGLGLFIVKAVVAGHRGAVSAESAGPGRGTAFTVTLPGVIPVPLGEPASENA